VPDSVVNSIISSASALIGVGLGLWSTHWREKRQRRRSHRSYWSALSAEIDLCEELAKAYVRDEVAAPLYRLPTLAYDNGFPKLLGDGAVLKQKDAGDLLRFYAQVIQINRALEYAHTIATNPDAPEGALAQEVNRLRLKAKNLYDPDCKDPGGPYYSQARAVFDGYLKRLG